MKHLPNLGAAEARMESVFKVAAFLVCSCRALVGRSPVLKIKSDLLGDYIYIRILYMYILTLYLWYNINNILRYLRCLSLPFLWPSCTTPKKSFTHKKTRWACAGSLYFTQISNEQEGVYHIYNFLRKPLNPFFSSDAAFECHAELNQDSETIWRTSYLNWCCLHEPTSAALEPKEETPLGKYHQQTI